MVSEKKIPKIRKGVYMIDFTKLPTRKKAYGGAGGGKLSILYKKELYMLKFPGAAKLNGDMSYANNCISEFLGCHIFESVGFPVQKTILGTYTTNGEEKIVVACKDFEFEGLSLQDFASIKNTIITSSESGYGTELKDIVSAIEKQTVLDPVKLSDWFWDMFIIDALIGNWDRHNGNWGFLYDGKTDSISIAPIYDCGSCIYPQADDKIMQLVLDDPKERNLRIFERPRSCIQIDGQKIHYFDFISSLENVDCNKALLKMYPRIDMNKIESIIEQTPYISDLQKKFYKTMLHERKERILGFSYKKLQDKLSKNRT